MTKFAINYVFEAKQWRAVMPKLRAITNKALSQALDAEDIAAEGLSISVVLADDAFVQELNKTYRSKNKPTNILSFQSDEEDYLGDLILAYETLEREAQEQHKTLQDHYTHLIVHGLLHLLGYNHEKDNEAKIMENKEISILSALNVKNPY